MLPKKPPIFDLKGSRVGLVRFTMSSDVEAFD